MYKKKNQKPKQNNTYKKPKTINILKNVYHEQKILIQTSNNVRLDSILCKMWST